MRRFIGFALLLVISTNISAQQRDFDYPLYPTMNVDYLDLSMNITLDPSRSEVRGMATYTVSANISGVSELILNTSESSIDAVTIGDDELDYEVRNDSLIIQLTDTLEAKQELSFTITWKSNSIYGYHVDRRGYMWASSATKSVRHWLPSFDHPRNELKVSATYIIPPELDVVATGDFVSEEVTVGSPVRELKWESTVDVPITSLNWAVGEFVKEEANAGIKKVRFYNQVDSDVETVDILRQAVTLLKDAEQELNYEYPYESLNVVYIESSYGEKDNYGAGTVYIYKDGLSITQQLAMGIFAQWFGVYKRPINKDLSDEFLQAAIYQRLGLEQPSFSDRFFGYIGLGILEYTSNELFKNTVVSIAPALLEEVNSIITWETLADKMYAETGQYWPTYPTVLKDVDLLQFFEIPPVTLPVTYEFHEASNEIDLILEAENDELDTLASARFDIYTLSDTLTQDVHFIGGFDTVTVKAEGLIDYATLTPFDTNMVFTEVKPLSFLVNQIRSSDPVAREAAALSMAAYANDPDLQLALVDVLNTEEVPEVRAAMLATYALITDGAIGTDQSFLQAARSDNETLKLSGINALALYPENDQAVSTLGSILLRAESNKIFEVTVDALLEVADSAALLSNADRLLRADSVENRTFFYFNKIQPIVGTNAIATRADQFLSESYPFPIRERAIELLGWSAYQEDVWPDRMLELVKDPDARIRVAVIRNSWKLADEEFNTLANTVRGTEYNKWVVEMLELEEKEREEKKADRL